LILLNNQSTVDMFASILLFHDIMYHNKENDDHVMQTCTTPTNWELADYGIEIYLPYIVSQSFAKEHGFGSNSIFTMIQSE
jgi:hypothetical protein